MFFWHLAWRNICVYLQRSLITALLAAATTAILVFSSAFMTGSHDDMIKNSVEIYPGYLQITHRNFRENPGYDHLIFDLPAVESLLAGHPEVAQYGARFETFVLYGHGERSVGGMLTGIQPAAEAQLSRLAAALKTGAYLEPGDQQQLYLGVELAKRLQLKVGDELFFIGTGADYSVGADLLTVKGVFQTGLFEFDAQAGFVNKSYLDQVMATDGIATHVVVLPKEPRQVTALTTTLNQHLNKAYQAESWLTRMADLVQAMLVDSIFGYLTLGILFMVIFFVIMIYTLLMVHARTREIGVLRALGTTPYEIFRLLLQESVILCGSGVLLGGIIGAGLAYYFYLYPMTISGYEEQFKQYGLAAAAIPAAFQPGVILRDMLVIFVLSLLAMLYPIVRVTRLRPIEAITHV